MIKEHDRGFHPAQLPVARREAEDSSSTPLDFQLPKIPWGRVWAGLFWLLGVYFTQQNTGFLGPVGAWVGAIAFQAGCTHLEGPIWRPRVYDYESERWYRRPIGLAACIGFLLDNLANMGGVWSIVKTLHTLPAVQSLAEMKGSTTQPLTGWLAILVCFVLGAFICSAPERLWYDSEYEVIHE